MTKEATAALTRPETVFLQHNDVFRVSDNLSTVTHDLLPGGVYLLEFNPLSGFYLTLKGDVTEPAKVYGSANETADRIINTFRSRPGRTTGVLLGGEKGSGKTMIMTRMSKVLAQEGIPTIIINNSYTGDAFNSFISAITQPAVLAFDEFEKVYGQKEQEEILTLLSGLFETHKLVVMTVNDESKINQHMLNRPGRLFYRVKYRGVDEATIRQYCGDHLKNHEHIDDVVALADTVLGFNFDMLVCLVEEMNRYDEPVEKAVRLMNINFASYGATYDVTVVLETGEVIKPAQWYGTLTEERHRVTSFNVSEIKDEEVRNKFARELQKFIEDREDVNDDRSSSDMSFVWKEPVKEEGNEEPSTYIDDLRGALMTTPENVVLNKSSWQQVYIHLRDDLFLESRGKVTRFKIPGAEIILRRSAPKASPFAYF